MNNNNAYYLSVLLNGKPNEIQSIYEINFPKVKKFILQNNGQQEDAEDIFQKALMQLAIRYQKEKFVIKTSFNGYLFTVCKNLWRRELNKNKNKVTNNQILELSNNNESEDLALSILEQKRQELFTECLSLISDNCNKILKLFFTKTPYNIITIKMKYNSETVARQRVFKCKKKLTELIKNDKRFNSLKEL